MNEGDQYKVWEIKALERPGHEKAKKMLEKIAKVVRPIMRKRKFRVNLLTEFCNPRLLGLNIGAGNHVKLRLRRFNREWDFLPFDQVLDTMLHELSHNVHGHHKADFHKLWDELRKECKELMPKKKSPLSSLCKRAVAAAEQMAKGIMGVLSPVQAGFTFIRQYDFWCGFQSSQLSGDEHVNSRKRNPVFIPSDVKFVDQTKDTAKVESQSCKSTSQAGCSSQLSGDNDGALHSEQLC